MSCSIILPNLINFLNHDNNDIFEKIKAKELQIKEQHDKKEQEMNVLNTIIQSKFILNQKLRIQETDKQYIIKAIIPKEHNFKQEEINVSIKNNRLIISAIKPDYKYQKTIDVSHKNLDISTIDAKYTNKSNTITITIQKQSLNNNDKQSVKIQFD